MADPPVEVPISGKGADGARFGWPKDDRIEQLRDAFARNGDPAKQ